MDNRQIKRKGEQMINSKNLMMGRLTKNILFIILGIEIGIWSIKKVPISLEDTIIVTVAVFAFFWDVYLWFQVFIKYQKDKSKARWRMTYLKSKEYRE